MAKAVVVAAPYLPKRDPVDRANGFRDQVYRPDKDQGDARRLGVKLSARLWSPVRDLKRVQLYRSMV